MNRTIQGQVLACLLAATQSAYAQRIANPRRVTDFFDRNLSIAQPH
jgi:hypothetical protein